MRLFRKSRELAARRLRIHTESPAGEGPRILFVSHEATRTGAPKIILSVLKHFREKTAGPLQTILHSGGFLAEEFLQYSETDCLNLPRESSDELARRVRKLCTRHRGSPPQLAICNSMESRFVAFELHRLGIPVVFLIHELPSSYEPEDYRQVYDCSHKVIFPVETVRDAAHSRFPCPVDKVDVMSQGLLDAAFGTRVPQETARVMVRAELGLPETAFIVLGCGTLDLRKGIDHYVAVARRLVDRDRVGRPIHFVWLGEGNRWTHSPYHYTMLDVEKSSARGHVHFVGERQDVEPWFAGSDVFLLASRVDPFPCVIHEAMAARLPVITFDKSGGATTAVGDGAGVIVPFGDSEAACHAIEILATQPQLAEMIRDRAERRVHQLYRFDHYANRIIRMAEEMIGQPLASPDLDLGPWENAAMLPGQPRFRAA